jgi:hypothetical protein
LAAAALVNGMTGCSWLRTSVLSARCHWGVASLIA